MSKLRRCRDPRSTYFITNVTYERRCILTDNSDLLWQSILTLQTRAPFDLQAWAILPEHFHLLLDSRDLDISKLLQRIKMGFSALYLKRFGLNSGRVWQNRFWDHIIRDQRDWNHHVDYVHYNPVKHGLVSSPFDWERSSIHEFHQRGNYSRDWGIKPLIFEGDFGE